MSQNRLSLSLRNLSLSHYSTHLRQKSERRKKKQEAGSGARRSNGFYLSESRKFSSLTFPSFDCRGKLLALSFLFILFLIASWDNDNVSNVTTGDVCP
jgi:hypothetical protein